MAYSNPYYPAGYNDYYNQRVLNKGGMNQPDPQFLSKFDNYNPTGQEQVGTQQSPTTGAGGSGGKVAGNVGNAVGIATAGLDTFNEAKNSPDGLVIDRNAGLTGAAKGAAAGSVGGAWGSLIGAIVGTVAGQVGTFAKVNKNLRKVNVNPDLTSYDANGRAVYQGGAAINSLNTLGTIKDSAYNIDHTSDITGTRWIGQALFGTKGKLKRKASQLQQGFEAGQKNFNNADISSINQQNQIQEYNNRLNGQNRMNNLYAIPKNYQQMF